MVIKDGNENEIQLKMINRTKFDKATKR